MRKLLSLILLVALCLLIVGNLYDGDLNLKSIPIEGRDSSAYVSKSVNGSSEDVIYGVSNDLEDGSANIVSSIVVNYRSFDTLGEVSVLFIASLGVAFLLGGGQSQIGFKYRPNFILRVGARMIFGFVVLLGIFMMSHGHLTPGGGFPGGSLIAAAMLILYLGDDAYRMNLKAFKVTESIAGTIYVLIGLVGLLTTGYFLSNFLDTGIVGTLYSAGLLPIVYVIIGLKVGSELTGVLNNFSNEEVAK